MFASKTDFRRNVVDIASKLEGNNYWYESTDDVNLHSVFTFKGHKYFAQELVHNTNGGACICNFAVYKYGTDDVIYSDYYHSGTGAWQTGDDQDAQRDYTPLTEYILKVLKGYL